MGTPVRKYTGTPDGPDEAEFKARTYSAPSLHKRGSLNRICLDPRTPGNPVHRYADTLEHRYTSTPVHQYTGTPEHRNTGTPIHQYTRKLVH